MNLRHLFCARNFAAIGLFAMAGNFAAQARAQAGASLPASTQPSAVAAAANTNRTPATEPVHMIVYSDFQCPYSAVMYQTLHTLSATYGGRLQVIWKQAPLPIHAGAPLAHRAAMAAGKQGKYDAMAALLYANPEHQSRVELISYAGYLHLDMRRFTHDIDSAETSAALNADLAEAAAMGVDSTPTSYLDGKRLTGIQSAATLTRLINKPADESATQAASGATALTLDAATMNSMAAGLTVRGNANAPVTLVEFTDFQCPFCAASAEPLRALLTARGEQVKVVYRAFPLDFHQNANLAAEAAFAAGAQGKFWEMHDVLFANQHALLPPDLDRYAEQLGLNMTVFRDALETHRFAGQVAADRALGVKAGVTGTPAFFLDGQVVEGALSLLQLEAWVDTQPSPGAVLAQSTRGPQTPAQAGITLAGAASAPVTITWFTDVRSASATEQAALIRSLLTSGKGHVRLVLKPFPSATRPDANLAAAALIVAHSRGKFWEMYDALASRRDVLNEDKLLAVASGMGLPRTDFAAALQAAQPDVLSEIEEAGQRGILGSPVIFINDQRVDGVQRQAFYTSILERELAPATTASLR